MLKPRPAGYVIAVLAALRRGLRHAGEFAPRTSLRAVVGGLRNSPPTCLRSPRRARTHVRSAARCSADGFRARRVRVAIFGTLLALSLHAQECGDAVLSNGFVMRNVRLERARGVTRLVLCGESNAGFVEFPSDQIARFDAHASEPQPSPPPSAPAPKTLAAPRTDSVKALITNTALRFMIDPDFVASVVKAESGANPAAVSPKGARGLMQLMPQTAAKLGVTDALDAAQNLEGGTRYLRQLLDQYNGNVAAALSAYNAGPGSVKRYGGVPPYAETRAYVARIITDYDRKKTARLNEQADAEATK